MHLLRSRQLMVFILSMAFLSPIMPLQAAENAPKLEAPLVNSYYPVYPPTKSATGELQALIKKGEYLAKLGDCISCHTNMTENTAPYAGGLPLSTPFGTFYSPNITPDEKTGIGTWTEQDFINAVKHGRSPQGYNYFPVFPYVYFANITDEDAKALYAYFMSIPPVALPNKSLPFPFNVPGARFSLWGWNLLFFYSGQTYQPEPNQSPEWNRGKYIVDGLGHCSMCHTPLNALGAPKSQYYLTGGFIDNYWAPNITSAGLETATKQDVADVFIKGQLINKAGAVAGPMAEVNHNSLKYLTPEDQLAIATYLKTVVSEEPMGLKPSNKKPSLTRGRQVYLKACITCHQNGEMGAPLMGNGPGWSMRLKERGLSDLYQHGIYGYNSMPYKGGCVTCSENDIISAVDYMLNESLSRSEWLDIQSSKEQAMPVNGKVIYDKNCGACHNSGQQGTPKIGDQAQWSSLLNKNLDVLVINTMDKKYHPEGGCKACSTKDVIEAVKYMVSQVKSDKNYSLW